MCLYAKGEIKTAKKNIYCYKSIIETENGKWTGVFYNVKYFVFNEILTAQTTNGFNGFKDIDHLFLFSGNRIYEGFHAAFKANRVPQQWFRKCPVKRCVIPKGSEYCEGLNDDVVSKNIVVFKNNTQYILYRLFGWFKLMKFKFKTGF